MSFLFKSKNKNAPPSAMPNALPPASRATHTSDGASTPSRQNTGSLDEKKGSAQATPAGSSSANGSMNSLADQRTTQGPSPSGQSGPGGPVPPYARRDRAVSELGSRPPPQGRPPAHADLYPWSQKQLTFTNAQSNPFPRYGAAVNSIASKEGDIYLMGGLIDGESVRGDLWMVEAGTQQLSCYPITTVSEGPGPRVGHASLLVGNAFIVFGGDTAQDETNNDDLDDTLYLLNTTSRQWSRAAPPGRRPAGRYGHTLNIVGSKIYIFGGQVEGAFFNDLVAFDLNALQNSKNQWEFLTPSGTAMPPARTNHTMISYGDSLYLFGGTDGQQWFNDVWCYEPKLNSWTQLDCIGYIPAPREGHSAALVNDVMYIFGGRTEHGDDLGDLAAFRIGLRRWYTFQNMGPSPSPRSGHSMTAYGKQVIVLAGEPSSAPRDTAELSMAYILDTAKIRYPNDAPASANKAISPTRQISDSAKTGMNARSASREETTNRNESPQQQMSGGPVQRPDMAASKLPRASMGPGATGPPPTYQPPNPTMNGAPTQSNTMENRATNGPGPIVPGALPGPQNAGSGYASTQQQQPLQMRQPPTLHMQQQLQPQPQQQQQSQHTNGSTSVVSNLPLRTDSRSEASNLNRDLREPSPGSQGRRTPQHQASKAKAMEAGEAAPLVGAAVARQRSQRSQRGHASVDGSEEGLMHRSSSGRSHADHRHSKSFAEEPLSPGIGPQNEALMREIEAVKGKNAWYASELALARKAGYTSNSPTADDRATMNFADDDRPLMEGFLAMRAELTRMQQNMESQAKSTAQRIAEVEHQRDAAITEAAYARAKLAAHGGSQRSTPQLESQRDVDDGERSTEISRRLALSLAAVNEHKAKVELLTADLEAERKARESAEEATEAAQNRFENLSNSRNPGELEALKAELLDTQSHARNESGRRAELEQKLRMLEIDHKELRDQHGDVTDRMTGHTSSIAALEAAVAASTAKAGLLERQLEDAKQARESSSKQLATLRAEHEKQAQELEMLMQKLQDAEDMAESHAREANTHREALMVGLAKIARPDSAMAKDAGAETRLAALQEAADEANRLAKANEQAAESAAQKLRSAEERIAGLEAYQEQSSREGLGIRRQLQSAMRDLRTHETTARDLRTQLETHQRDASALQVQHGALKDLLGERGVDMSTSRRSPATDGLGSRNGTPDLARTRELEAQLQTAQRVHEETKALFEAREQEAEKTYRERLESLDNDYQSLMTYVKGTEKMLKKMREELTKYKTANMKLSTELESTRDGKRSVGSNNTDATEWAAERDHMQASITELRTQMSAQIDLLESNMATVKADLARTQTERDSEKASHSHLAQRIQKSEEELEQLKHENQMLESRAVDAEHRVTMLLDQVGSSVTNYRRQSQMQPIPANGVPGVGARAVSPSTATDTSSQVDDHDEARGSMALDSFASELESLKAQWESSRRKSYQLRDQFDFERTPTREVTEAPGLSETLSKWRNDEDQTPTVEKSQASSSAPMAGLSSASK